MTDQKQSTRGASSSFLLRLKRAVKRFLKIDQYEFAGESIRCHHGWWRDEAIAVAEIESWSVFHEMAFDIVCIHLKDQNEMQLTDSEGELSEILCRVVGAPRREHGV